EEGRLGAKAALDLHQNSTRFLSTIQVGITSIGILSGAIGEKALSDPLSSWLVQISFMAPYAKAMSTAITVIILTYLSVVIGELVPKRLALLAPEAIASVMARPMNALSRIFYPLVSLFSLSSEVLLGLFRARVKNEPPISDNEIRLLMVQGAEAGIFHESEQEIVSNVLRLDLQPVVEIMTPRHEMAVIDLEDEPEEIRKRLETSDYARLVVCRGGMEQVVGIMQAKDLLKKIVDGHAPDASDIEAIVQVPLYVPETVSTIRLMENFRDANTQFALIVDEYGVVQGIVTSSDVMVAIVGDLSAIKADAEKDMIRRENGSWLVDGDVTIEKLSGVLALDDELPGSGENRFYTVGGFLMHTLGKIPAPADYIDAHGWRFEVMDMEKNRVDKVLISKN
ncbi:MAG: HlyC/CorC family transporter, partial [Oxalobacter sp.]|nr:HlyC/CorC family transporter [Oxalobacter sp.]